MLVVVSDFHLSEGRDSETGKISPTEDFFFDDQFSRFLTYLNTHSPGNVHLIINGDLADFLQIRTCQDDIQATDHLAQLNARDQKYIHKYGAKTDEASSIFKLEKMFKGHETFFSALRSFLFQGNKLTIIVGNHDIEFFWPGMQNRFRELLTAQKKPIAADGGTNEINIEFSLWNYYDPDRKVYIEHGHQYESLNSFRYLLRPVLPGRRTELNLPFGSLFVRYFLNPIEKINPFADNIKPNTKYIGWVIKNHPLKVWQLAKVLVRFIITLAKALRRTGKISRYDASAIVRFEAESQEELERIAHRSGITGDISSPAHPLQLIRRLHKRPFNDGKTRFLWQALLSNLDVLFFLTSGVAAVAFVSVGLLLSVQAVRIGAFVITGLAAAAGEIFFKVTSHMDKANVAVADRIFEIMNDSGHNTKYVVFGHTHTPAIVELAAGGRYFNTGTWGVIFNDEDALIREKKQFSFLLFDEVGQSPELMRWNDAVGLPERLPLFDFD